VTTCVVKRPQLTRPKDISVGHNSKTQLYTVKYNERHSSLWYTVAYLWHILSVVLHAALQCSRQQRSNADFVANVELLLPLQSTNERKYERLRAEKNVKLLQTATHALVNLRHTTPICRSSILQQEQSVKNSCRATSGNCSCSGAVHHRQRRIVVS